MEKKTQQIYSDGIDIKEDAMLRLNPKLLDLLLWDQSSRKNIIWATTDYVSNGIGFEENSEITAALITGENRLLIRPRIAKELSERLSRTRDKAEVFTPSWICNQQNNLLDNAWFGRECVFNTESEKSWMATTGKIEFPPELKKTWQDYVRENRLEITCGEAPYLVSRYDTVTGEKIDTWRRIGLLDRKLRIVSENIDSEPEWVHWAEIAFQSTYGFDWQGDNVLLARENLLFTFVDFYEAKFEVPPIPDYLLRIAEILSWNIWQMDGLKFVIPNSCHDTEVTEYSLFDETKKVLPCEGCLKNAPKQHNGVYCKVKDWNTGEIMNFVSLISQR